MAKIGAESDWAETSNAVYNNFARTGDWMTNSRPNLETVINAGVRTIVYDGDAVSCEPWGCDLVVLRVWRSTGLYSQLQRSRGHGVSPCYVPLPSHTSLMNLTPCRSITSRPSLRRSTRPQRSQISPLLGRPPAYSKTPAHSRTCASLARKLSPPE